MDDFFYQRNTGAEHVFNLHFPRDGTQYHRGFIPGRQVRLQTRLFDGLPGGVQAEQLGPVQVPGRHRWNAKTPAVERPVGHHTGLHSRNAEAGSFVFRCVGFIMKPLSRNL